MHAIRYCAVGGTNRRTKVKAALRPRRFPHTTQNPVGASLLAMVVNDNAGYLNERGALESIASMLAPTGFAVFFGRSDHAFAGPCK